MYNADKLPVLFSLALPVPARLLGAAIIASFLMQFMGTVAYGQDGNVFQSGKDIFDNECAPCHDDDGAGSNTVDIRGSRYKEIANAIEGIEDMPEIDLNEKEIKALAVYLSWLESNKP